MLRLHLFLRQKPIGKGISRSLRSLTSEKDFLGSLLYFCFELVSCFELVKTERRTYFLGATRLNGSSLHHCHTKPPLTLPARLTLRNHIKCLYHERRGKMIETPRGDVSSICFLRRLSLFLFRLFEPILNRRQVDVKLDGDRRFCRCAAYLVHIVDIAPNVVSDNKTHVGRYRV